MFIIHNAKFLDLLASEGMRRAMELYNAHVWMASVVQPALYLPVPSIPFFYVPTWETPMVYTWSPTHTMIAPPFPLNFSNIQDLDPLYHYFQMNEGTQREGFPDQNLGMMGLMMESPHSTIPNNLASTSQVPPVLNLASLRPVSTTTQKIEEALEIMRETRKK